MTQRLYELTPEHRGQLDGWRDTWIANAMSTAPMSDHDRAVTRAAIKGLYEAAHLTPPPDERIVFVPSPFVMRFAGGFASALWWLRKKQATEAATGQATEAATWQADATRLATGVATRDATAAATRQATVEATRQATRDATWQATVDATRQATVEATRQATVEATAEATRQATVAATRAATRDATRDATWQATGVATGAATREATAQATRDATRDATEMATWQATAEATEEATVAATRDAMVAATRDAMATRQATVAATRAATRDATRDATWQATVDATVAATRDATRQATRDAMRDAMVAATVAATRAATWYRLPLAPMVQLARAIFGPQIHFGLGCAEAGWRMWDGGNQYSAWVSYLSFFRHVAKLDLDYSQWQHYETAAIHSGPRMMHAEFCLVSDRPSVLLVDDQHRPHCETGPFCVWRDGTALYAWHGIYVPEWVIASPESITADTIHAEGNAEIRRAMLALMGAERYVASLGVAPIHQQETPLGTEMLYVVDRADDMPLVLARVINQSPEPLGSSPVGDHVMQGNRWYKRYWLRCPPPERATIGGTAVSIRTVEDARAWSFQVPVQQFQLAQES